MTHLPSTQEKRIAADVDIAYLPADVDRIVTNHPTALTHEKLTAVLEIPAIGEPNATLAVTGVIEKRGRIFAMGDLPTTVRITAVKQDGTSGGSFDFRLNDPGHSGAFAQIPVTEDTFPEIDGNPMAMRVETLDGSPVGSYIVTLDNISSDTVFVQGTPVR